MDSLINTISSNLVTVILVIAMIFYLCQCLFGYKLLKFSCAFVGFILGLFLGYYIGKSLIGLPDFWPWIIGVILGILLLLIAFKIYLVGVFILVFIMAASLAYYIPFPEGDVWKVVSIIIAVAIGILAAVLAVRFNKIVIILFTSIMGSVNCITNFNHLTGYLSVTTMYYVVIAILALVGIVLQLSMNR